MADPSVEIEVSAEELPDGWQNNQTLTRRLGDEWLNAEEHAWFRVRSFRRLIRSTIFSTHAIRCSER
jgi:hypothetical protein